MRSLILVLAILCVASSAEATSFAFRGRSNFRSQQFHGQRFSSNNFNDGFRQGFNAGQRQQFNNGFHQQQFRGGFIRAPFFRFGF